MSDIKTGGPAFPRSVSLYPDGTVSDPGDVGMTLRDYFAAKALQPPVFSPIETEDETYERVAREAYKMADAMLKARGE